MNVADTIFLNANILTQDTGHPHATAFAVREGRILAVGEDHEILAMASRHSKRVNLAGRAVIPGFNDAHAHVWKIGQLLEGSLDVRGCASIVQLKRELHEYVARQSDKWIQARGYNELILAEGRHPTRDDLDQVSATRPIILVRTCAHIAVLNSVALELAGIDATTPDPIGGAIDRDDEGRATGVLRETALGLVFRKIPKPALERYKSMIRAARESQLAFGITATTDPAVDDGLVAAYRSLDAEGTLRGRVNLLYIRRPDGGSGGQPLPKKHLSKNLRLDSIKLFADGGLSGATAALSIPYRHADTRGTLRLGRDELYELSSVPHREGWRVATHAIGDDAIEAVLQAYERLYSDKPSAQRHRIEHLGLPNADQLARVSNSGIIVVSQPIFLRELGANICRYLPKELLPRCYPHRAIIDAGIHLAFSTDAPVVREQNPFVGIQTAIDRKTADGDPIAVNQTVGIAEALSAYTLGGAIASGDEENFGSIAVGKWADFLVLGANPLTTDVEELHSIAIDSTWIAGKLTHGTQ